MSPSTTDARGAVRLADKVAFLSDPAAYPGLGREIETIETHMSLVFLVGDRAFKLKKPVRFPYLDFSTLAARETYCRAELALNRRLAPDVYLRVARLALTTEGALALDGDGEAVDWLVAMRRLPADRMLDALIAEGGPGTAAVERLAVALARFYDSAERPLVSPEEYVRRLEAENDDNRDILTRPGFRIDQTRAQSLLDRMSRALSADRSLLEGRASGRFLVDGHGDLRPEHVCFENGVIIYDRLEFSPVLREVDPVDELASLATECARLGADWIGPRLVERVMTLLGWPDPGRLYPLHAARRSFLRARLALSHLLDAEPRQPERWAPLATRYLALAGQALDRIGAR
jgi:aminoglycoside phosphotransferase family enzyme